MKVQNFNNLNDTQRVNYVKNLLFSYDLIDVLDELLKYEKKDLRVIKIINKVLDDDLIINRIKEQCYLGSISKVKSYVYSKIISLLSFYNKTIILNSFFKFLDEETLKDLAYYEYQNKTEVSICSKVFKKYCYKYKENALAENKLNDEDILMLTTEMERYNNLPNKKVKNNNLFYSVLAIITVILFLVFIIIFNFNNNKLKEYDNKILPGIYINNINLDKKTSKELHEIILKEKNKIENGTLIITNPNGDYKFTYLEVGINLDSDVVENEIIDYNNNLNRYKKLIRIKNKKKKDFYLTGNFEEEKIDKFIKFLESKLNVKPKNDSLMHDDKHNVYYDKGFVGFKLDSKAVKKEIINAISNLKEETKIEAKGKIVNNEIKYKYLSMINTKISTFTTNFNNYGNRGFNIRHASSKLNGTILMPGDVFSYLKVVGPYDSSNGYLAAPVYRNGVAGTAAGGGVCQLASTLYNAQLRAGLQTIYRTNHSHAPAYVPKGLDATVYGKTTNYKFKNQYDYPIYISSFVNGNNLTVEMWSSKDTLGNKTYEPYAVYSNGGYVSYLIEYQNGIKINERYLGKSYYMGH